MRKSRSETAHTRERIISAAAKLFLEEGLAATGMREVMAEAGLTPGGFYRHFQSKDQLIAEASSIAFDRLLHLLENELGGIPPAKAIDRIISLYLNQSRTKQGDKKKDTPYLCPLANLGVELSHADPEVRAIATDGHRRLVQILASQLKHLSTREASVKASGIVSTMVGAVTLAGIAPDSATASAILRNANAFIKLQISQAVK